MTEAPIQHRFLTPTQAAEELTFDIASGEATVMISDPLRHEAARTQIPG